jgi:peptidoglycan/LPS O-acetylase OafA/YrhL
MKYMKQLDSLRAIAVLFVLFDHFYSCKTQALPFLKQSIPWGGIGVRFFFVLSGFLITYILLKNRGSYEAGISTLSEALRVFYARRALRIFPIYFIAVFGTLALSISPVRETLFWLISHTSNFYIAKRGDWHGPISHLWSLSVEEQFYLVWPLFIILTPKRYLLSAISVVILSAPVFRHICSVLEIKFLTVYVLPFGHIDLFGIGALLAYLKFFNVQNRAVTIFLKASLLLGIASFFDTAIYAPAFRPKFFGCFSYTFNGLLYGWIIWNAAEGFKGIAGRILEMSPLVYIGKISYGIYLYHLFIPEIIRLHFERFYNYLGNQSIFVQLLIFTPITLVISSISWFIVEKPILSLKEKHRQKTSLLRTELAPSEK